MLYALAVVLVLILDQWLKYWVTINIALDAGSRELIPGIVSLVNIHNSGAAYGILDSGNWRWVFVAIAVIFTVLAVIALKKPEKGDDAFTDRIRRFRAALAEEAGRINAEPDVYKAMMQKLGLLSGKAAEHYVMLRFEEPLTPLGLPSEEDIRHYAEWMKQNRLLKKDVPALADIVFQDVK